MRRALFGHLNIAAALKEFDGQKVTVEVESDGFVTFETVDPDITPLLTYQAVFALHNLNALRAERIMFTAIEFDENGGITRIER